MKPTHTFEADILDDRRVLIRWEDTEERNWEVLHPNGQPAPELEDLLTEEGRKEIDEMVDRIAKEAREAVEPVEPDGWVPFSQRMQ